MNKHEFFDYFVILLALVAVILVLIELFVPLTHEQIEFIETVDFYIVMIFVIDLIIQFEKYHHSWRLFFKHCWIDIVAIIPFHEIFRLFKFLRILKVVKAAKLAKLSKLAKFEKLLKLDELFKIEKIGKLNKALHLEVALKGFRSVKSKRKNNLKKN